ncbi:MAG TPA: hypothetical protein VHM91_24040, partial [Verrucomicrobiales bacterium]|nr:hypothetical protein [Verrucomicrobiales bacterium]
TGETVIVSLRTPSGAALNGNTTHQHTFTDVPHTLTVTPLTAVTGSGTAGGAFDLPDTACTLQNAGGTDVVWSAATGANWLELSSTGGMLHPGQTVEVSVSLTSQAASLPPGHYTSLVSFSDATSGQAGGSRSVVLEVGLGAPVVTDLPLFTGGSADTVSWNALAGAEAYEVQQSEESSFADAAGSGWITATQYPFTGLTSGSRQYFRVRARNASAVPPEGSWSAVKSTTQDAAGPLLTVTGMDTPVVTDLPEYTLSGTVSDLVSGVASVTVNGLPATVTGTGWTAAMAPLTPGENTITIVATDNAVPPNQTTERRSVYLVSGSLDADHDGLPDAWEYSHQLDLFDDGSLSPVNGPLGDPDFDGMSNLMEYAFNTDPNQPDGPVSVSLTALPPSGEGDAGLYITYRRRVAAPGIDFEVRFSPDMASWAPEPDSLQPVSILPDADGITESVTQRILPGPGDGGAARPFRFFRLQVIARP